MFFAIFFLEISSESMATKEAKEIKEEAVATQAPSKKTIPPRRSKRKIKGKN